MWFVCWAFWALWWNFNFDGCYVRKFDKNRKIFKFGWFFLCFCKTTTNSQRKLNIFLLAIPFLLVCFLLPSIFFVVVATIQQPNWWYQLSYGNNLLLLVFFWYSIRWWVFFLSFFEINSKNLDLTYPHTYTQCVTVKYCMRVEKIGICHTQNCQCKLWKYWTISFNKWIWT